MKDMQIIINIIKLIYKEWICIKKFNKFGTKKEISYNENLNTNVNEIINHHNKLTKYFMDKLEKEFNNNNFENIINKIYITRGRGLRRHNRKHDETGNTFQHCIKLFRILIIIRSIILITLWLINGINGYFATKHIDIILARKFKNLNTCLITYKIIESIVVMSIISFIAINYFKEHEFMVKLSDKTIF